MSDDLSTVLFGFSQAAFFGDDGLKGVAPDFEDALTRIGERRTLRAETVVQWPRAARSGLKELLTAWIIVLELDRVTGGKASKSHDLAEGATSTRLTERIVDEILRRSSDLRSIYSRQQRDRTDPSG